MEKIKQYEFFLHRDSHQEKLAPENTIFWLGVTFCVSHSIWLKISLINNKTGKKHMISLIFCMEIRVQISSLHFAKCEGVLCFNEALSQRNNKNAKLSIAFLAPTFHLVTIIFKQDNVLQKHLISWHDLILQPPRQANFRAVCLTSFMFYVLNYYISLLLCFI